MAANGLGFTEPIGAGRHVFMFPAKQRPELPTLQPVAMAQMEEGIDVVVSYDILFPGLDVERQHDEENFIAEKAVFQMTIEGDQRRVVFLGNGRALLEIKREDSKAISGRLLLRRPSANAQKLKKLPAVLSAVPVVGDHRINKIEFDGFRSRVAGV